MSHATEAHFTALDLKAIADDGVFEGYASLFNREDLGRDIVAPGAFAQSIAQKGAAGIRLLFQHDPAQPIGVWTSLVEDAKGLFVRGRLTPGVARAREVLSLMRAGAIDGLSIGFRPLKARRDRARGIRLIEKVDLWEISIVTFPMLPGARIEAAKSRPFARRLPTEREFEQWLTQEAGLTRSEARAVIRHGLKGLAGTRDAAPGLRDTALAERLARVASLLRTPVIT
ncbi:MAG: HK97 family phage prohead protease [Proteobacteria bacterium]|nr:HK97 family phage prohead protease [Pseudomonadota bacterium]